MGQSTSASPSKDFTESVTPTPPPPVIPTLPNRHQSQSAFRKHLKKLLKCFLISGCRNRQKLKRKRAKQNKMDMTMTSDIFTNPNIIIPSTTSDLQLHWLRSKHSILSYALSKLAFFSRLSQDKLKDDSKKRNRKLFKFSRDKGNGNDTKTDGRISLSKVNSDRELRMHLHKMLSEQHVISNICISAANRGTLRKIRSPDEIYQRNLKKFERLVAITASSTSSSSSTSHDSLADIFIKAKTAPPKIPDGNNNETVEVVEVKVDENENPVKIDDEKPVKKEAEKPDSSGGSGNLLTKFPPRRIITTSKNRVEIDVHFMNWVKDRVSSSSGSPPKTGRQTTSSSDSSPKTANTQTTTVGNAEVTTSTTTSTTSSSESKKGKHPDKNNNQPEKKEKFEFLRKGGGRRASVGGRCRSKSPAGGKSGKSKSAKRADDTSTQGGTTTATTQLDIPPPTNPPPSRDTNNMRCDKCGPCAGKYAMAGAPPAYLDYGVAGAANAAGEAWKGKRKGDPVMDRLKNVDVVEEMTYLVPSPDCGGQGDCCDEVEEDDCDYYAVCESCGEMEPLPEEIQREMKQRRKKKKEKADSTPVTYSRRQRFNFKQKGDMCDEDEGPPYLYDGLQCPGSGCRCSCCVAGLRRNPNCGCNCCQVLGQARKCNSFDEFPVGKNPQIRRILCPEEECEKRREAFKESIPEASGMYKFDVCEQIFERQVPRTPTPIILEVEAPAPLTNAQLLSLGREIQETKRLGIGVDAYCCPPPPPPCNMMATTTCQPCQPCTCPEKAPLYLPPVYGQCNPPCCVPNLPYCTPQCGAGGQPGQQGQQEEKNSENQSIRSSYDDSAASAKPHSQNSEYTYTSYSYSYTGSTVKTEAKKAPSATAPAKKKDINANYTTLPPVDKEQLETSKKTSSSESLPSLQSFL